MRTWFVTAVLVAMALTPMLHVSTTLEDSAAGAHSSPLQVSLSASSGWTSGGEDLTITGTGFRDMADRNVTYDGMNHQWTKTTADYTDGSGPENAIVVDSNGHVHVVYINGGNFKIMHAEFDGSGWNTGEVDSCAGSYCWDAHMVIDDNDELHVAYSAQGEKLVYQHYDGQDWNGGVVSSYARFAPVGIAVDSNNLPHISYSQTGQWCGNGLRLASFDGSTWTTQGIDAGTNKGCDSSIVIDENDHIYIAYQDRDGQKLKFATNKSGSWLSYAPDASSFGNTLQPGYSTSLVMDEQGQFHIAHYDSHNEDLRYSTGVPNGAWTNTIVDASGDTGRNPAIAVDAAGDLHITYSSWSGFDLKYATLKPSSSSTWQKSNIQTQDQVGDESSIVIDANGMIHVAYSDDTNEVLKYATKSTGVVVTDEITVQFGQLGAVTGDVLDDETIQLSTPTVASPGVVTVSLIDKNGDEHTLAPSFEFIDQNDLDGDGVANANDDCPNDAGTSTQDQVGCPDDDGDGYSNAGDAFPNDANEWVDSDGDGVGNNADAFPNDPTETADSDGDGVGDNADAFPNNGFEQYDSDG
ncbi:MAG: IPT/TIG domain-containing protein, partial [Poseidonia sp.]